TRAVQFDDTLAEAHIAMGEIKFDEWDWDGARGEFARALDLNPNLPDGYHLYGQLLLILHQDDEALRVLERGHAIDPLSLTLTATISWTLLTLGRADDAIRMAEQALQLNPDFSLTHSMLCTAYDAKRRFPDALRECRKAVDGLDYGGTWADLGYEYARSGKAQQAREILDRMARLPPETAAASGGDFALVYVGLGEHERALAALEKAVARHDEHLLEINSDARLQPLHAYPRFGALMRQM